MPTADRIISQNIEKFLVPLRRGGRKQRTLDAYRYLLERDLNFLRENGLNSSPSKIGSPEIEYLINVRWTGSPKYNHNRRSLMRQFLEYHGNRIFDEYPESVCNSCRINVDWLSDIEAVGVYRSCQTPIEKMIIHLELRLALRRFDMMNLTLKDIHAGSIDVLGKGSKYRSVPFVSDTATVLCEYMSYRDSITEDRSPDSTFLMIPDRMSDHSGKLPGKTYVDQIVKRVCSRAVERSVSNHTLRRTCARMWYRAGVPLATISSLLGHTDVKTTIKYLGLTLDDLSNGASLYDAYFDGISVPETAVSSDEAKKKLSSKRSGLGEI